MPKVQGVPKFLVPKYVLTFWEIGLGYLELNSDGFLFLGNCLASLVSRREIPLFRMGHPVVLNGYLSKVGVIYTSQKETFTKWGVYHIPHF